MCKRGTQRLRRLLAAAVVATAVLAVPGVSSAAVVEFSAGITAGAQPLGIANGPDGNVWFTEHATSKIGRITPDGTVSEFALAAGRGPRGIVTGPDGNIWFAEEGFGVGVMSPAGVLLHEYATGIPGATAAGIASGPDGNLWFTEPETGFGAIGRVTPAGVVTNFTAGVTATSGPLGIAAGPDGNMWFTEYGRAAVGRVTMAGAVTEFTTGIAVDAAPQHIATGPDGRLWFAESGNHRVGLIATDGSVAQIDVSPFGLHEPVGVVKGPDDLMYFVDGITSTNAVARVLPDASVQTIASLAADAEPVAITVGPDGRLWVAEATGGRIARVDIPPAPAPPAPPAPPPPPQPAAPTAQFAISPAGDVDVNQPVVLDASKSTGEGLTYDWTIDEGGRRTVHSGSQRVPQYTFRPQDQGRRDVTLVVTDAQGRHASAQGSFTVTTAPALTVEFPTHVAAGKDFAVRVVALRANGKSGPLPPGYTATLAYEGAPLRFGFGANQTTGYERSLTGVFTGVRVTHPGDSPFNITVTDPVGAVTGLGSTFDVNRRGESTAPAPVRPMKACLSYQAPASTGEVTILHDCSLHLYHKTEIAAQQEALSVEKAKTELALIPKGGHPPLELNLPGITLGRAQAGSGAPSVVEYQSSDTRTVDWDDGNRESLPDNIIALGKGNPQVAQSIRHQWTRTSEDRFHKGIRRDIHGAYLVQFTVNFRETKTNGDPGASRGSQTIPVPIPVGENVCTSVTVNNHVLTPVNGCLIYVPHGDSAEYSTTRATDPKVDPGVDIDGLRLYGNNDGYSRVVVSTNGSVVSSRGETLRGALNIGGGSEIDLGEFRGGTFGAGDWHVPTSSWDIYRSTTGPPRLGELELVEPADLTVHAGRPVDGRLRYEPNNTNKGVGVTLADDHTPARSPIVLTAADLRSRSVKRQDADFDGSEKGFDISNADVPLGPLSLKNGRFGVRLSPFVVYGGGTLEFPSDGIFGGSILADYNGSPDNLNLGTTGFQFSGPRTYVGGTFNPDPPINVAGVLQITQISAHMELNPFNFRGTVQMTNAGPPIMAINGCGAVVWGAATGLPVDVCQHDGYTGGAEDPDNTKDTRKEVRTVVAGDLALDTHTAIGKIPVASAWAEYRSPSYVRLHGHTTVDTLGPLFTVTADLDGAFDSWDDWGVVLSGKAEQKTVCELTFGLVCPAVYGVGGVGTRGIGFCGGGTLGGVHFDVGWDSVNGPMRNCDEIEKVILPSAGSARAAQAPADRKRATVTLPGGVTTATVDVAGAGGIPRLTLAGPHGARYAVSDTQSAFGPAGHRVVVARSGDTDALVLFQAPTAGERWTLTSQDRDIVKVTQSAVRPPATVRAKVSARGARRALVYTVHAPPSQTVTFYEASAGIDRKLGVARQGRGVLRFRPTTARDTARKIVARATRHGIPLSSKNVARFTVAAPRGFGTVKRLRVRRSRRAAIISFRPAAGATGYTITVSQRGRPRRQVHVGKRARVVSVRGLVATRPATVKVATDGTLTRGGASVTVHVGRDRTKLPPIVF